MFSTEMGRGIGLIVVAYLCIAARGQQDGLTSTHQESRVTSATPREWHSETCEDLCGCVEGVMKGLNNTQTCMEVRGYPCHLMRQLQRVAEERTCSVEMEGTWFECEHGKTLCVGGNSVDDGVKCNEDNATEGSTIAYLGCETTVGVNTSVTCVLSRDKGVMGQCVNNAECHYKKERVSCPSRWEPFKRHCLSPSGMLDQQNWHTALNRCIENWQSTLLTIKTFTPEEIQLLEEKVLKSGRRVWLGLSRASENSTFRWTDNTPVTEDQSQWPWAEGHPIPGHNFVYIFNRSLYSDKPTEKHRFSCEMRVSKSLRCRHPRPTTIPVTTDLGVVETTTLEEATTVTKEPKKPIDKFREGLVQLSDSIGSFTNDTAVIDAVGYLIAVSNPRQSDTGDTSPEEKSNSIEKSLDSLMDSLAGAIDGPDAEPLVVSTPEMVLKVLTLCSDCDGGEPMGGQIGNQTFLVSLPDSFKAIGATLALSTASLLHKELPSTIEDDNGLTKGDKTQTTIGSLVSTLSLRRWDGEDVILTQDAPLQLTFSNLKTKQEIAVASCRYWKATGNASGVWSSDGCNAASSNSTHTVCHMTHLTSFAVIMQISNQQDLPKSLEYLTWAGCALSITCLVIMLVIFLSQKMYRADRNIIHMNLAVSLMLAQLIFVFGIDSTEEKNPQGVCKTVGILLHFFLLATFFWMLNEGIFLLSKTTSAKTRWLRLPTYVTVGWVFPVIIVGTTMAVSFESYDTEHRCWLTVENGGIWAFIAPAAAVILINICIIIQVIRVFLSLRANMNKKKAERIRIALRAILLTLPLLGCTWLIGLLSFNADTLVFAYIFVILNSLQGVFIFILYCLLNDEIKKGLRKRLASLQSLSGKTSNTRASRTATGASNQGQSNKVSKTQPEYKEAVKL